MGTNQRSDTRRRIAEVALELFAEGGFEGTSLQQIADRLDLTKAALYYHFRSKDDLLAEIIEPAFDDLDRSLDVIESSPSTAAARRAGVAAYLDYLIDHRAVIGLLSRDLSLLAHPAVVTRGGTLQARIENLLMGTELDPADRVLATMALGGMQAAIALPPEGDPAEFREVVLAATESVLRTGRRRRSARSTSRS